MNPGPIRVYSEYTPGEPASVGCDKGHWEFTENDGPRTFYERIRLARCCQDFEVTKWISELAPEHQKMKEIK